jgi:hypothetical protein
LTKKLFVHLLVFNVFCVTALFEGCQATLPYSSYKSGGHLNRSLYKDSVAAAQKTQSTFVGMTSRLTLCLGIDGVPCQSYKSLRCFEILHNHEW